MSATTPAAVLEAMQAELQRSLGGLKIPETPKPYHLLYSLRRRRMARLRAAYGSLQRDAEDVRCELYVDVRVGTHEFDNVFDGGLEVEADDRESAEWLDAPQDLDPTALKISLWKLTQIKFDEAVEDYFDHRKASVSEYLRDEVGGLTRERAVVHLEDLDDSPFPRAQWAQMLTRLSKRFLDHSEIYDPSISLRADRVHRWLVTSDGSRVITENSFVEVDFQGWVLGEDGVYVEATRSLYARALDDVPSEAELERELDALFGELDELRDTESPGSYIGPALLSGQAASTMFHEALGHRLEGERLVARGETRTFASKLGERVLPGGLDVFDDPTVADWNGVPLLGSYRVDDEGVRAQRAPLIDDGKLVGFLQSRTPIPGSKQSNGHARHDGVQLPMARMSNLIVRGDPKRAVSAQELERRLVELAKAQGRRHAAVIEHIRDGETSTNSYDFQVFKGELSRVYLLDVETGRRRRVRDVELVGTPLAAMQRITAFGGAESDGVDHGYCFAESGSVPVSGVSPAVLLTEVELQQKSTSSFHDPLLPPPFADDGSRGRTAGGPGRGRRKR